VSVTTDADVSEDCRIAAGFKGISLAGYLGEAMRVGGGRNIDGGDAPCSADSKPEPGPRR
jgi:hypothetical protein